MKKWDLIATATFGLEAVVARELRNLGYQDLEVENSRVLFKGSAADICRTNLWLRSADRVLIRMGEFKALSFEELFEKTKALPWEELLTEDAEFPVQGKSIKSKLFSVPDCQAIVKKAIVERLKQKYKREWFEETGPRYRLEVGILRDIVTLTVDTSGQGLHKRGYRQLANQAPLKETLASALVALSYWNTGRYLIDPFCGSGTILIEAAMQGLNIAPGLNRAFDAEAWPQISKDIWEKAKSEARAATKNVDFRLIGYDIDEQVLSIARHNAQLAGVGEYIDFHRRPFSEFSTKTKYGCIISNPPYGERMGERRDAQNLYREMGKRFKELDTWSIYILTADEEFEKLYGRRASKKRKLYNGRIKVDYYQYYGPRPPS